MKNEMTRKRTPKTRLIATLSLYSPQIYWTHNETQPFLGIHNPKTNTPSKTDIGPEEASINNKQGAPTLKGSVFHGAAICALTLAAPNPWVFFGQIIFPIQVTRYE